MAKTDPIRPDEIINLKKDYLPSEIIQAINECIIKNWNGKYSRFTLKEVTSLMLEKMLVKHKPYTRQMIYDNGYVDFEDVYRDVGWKVVYDKPGFNENYQANFTFSR